MACALLLLIALPAAGREIAPPLPSERWLSLKADRLEIISNATPAVTEGMARKILGMRAAVRHVTPVEIRPHRPLKVVIFANGRGFAPYREAISREKTKFSSVWLRGKEGNSILLQADAEDGGLSRAAYRDLTEYFLEQTNPPLPFWFRKGVVQYFSTFNATQSHVELGWPLTFIDKPREQPFHLRELLAPPKKDMAGVEWATMSLLGEPQSWTVVHYLMAEPDRRAQLGSLLELAASGKDVEQAVRQAFGKTDAELAEELRAYAGRARFPHLKVSLGELGVTVPKAELLPHDQVLYELGHLLASTVPDNTAAAERFLTQALKINPANALALVDLAWLHERAGRPQQAEEAYAKAVQLGSGQASVYLTYGVSILNRLATRADPPPAELLKAREVLQRATELDPQSARAWTALGITYARGEGDRAPGIAALETSLKLAPDDPDAAAYLAHLYADAGRRADADRIVKTMIPPSAPPAVRARGRRAVLLGAIREAESLARSGKVKSAATLARSVVEHADDEEMKKYAQALLAEIDTAAAALRLLEERNVAVRHANAGRNDEALAILDRILPEITDPEMRTQTQAIRDQVAARIPKRPR